MPAAFLNPSQLTFTGQEIRATAELIIKELITAPAMEQFLTVKEDIVALEKIGFASDVDKMTKAYSGCNPSFTTKNVPFSEKEWTPAKVEILNVQCLDDLEDSFFVYLKKLGKDSTNWEGTDMLSFFIDRINPGTLRDFTRIVWFNDKDASNYNVSPAGKITNSVSLTDYNLINGLWKQLFSIATTNAARKTAIAKNAGNSYANQTFDDTDTTNKVATDIFRKLVQNAHPTLKSKSDGMIVCTRSMADQYSNELEAASGIPASWDAIQNGISMLKKGGVPIFAVDFFDETIRADFDNGSVHFNPHRAVYTTKANLLAGVDAKSSIGTWNQFYLPKERNNYIMGGYKVDAKVAQDHLVQVAF